MADTSYPPANTSAPPTYAPSPLTAPVVQPARPVTATPPVYPPSPIASPITSALIKAGATPHEATVLTAVSGAESNYGRSPVSGVNHDGSRDYGAFQINDKAHPQMGGAAVARMPLEQQAALALQIARSKEGFGAWTTYKTGAYTRYLGDKGAASAPSTPTGAPSFAQAGQQGNIGAALAALNQKDASGKSPLDPLTSAMAPQQTPSSQQQSSSAQMSANPMAYRNANLPAMAAPLLAQVLEQSARPLTWSSGPPGSNAGQQVPGTTLNSTQGYG